MSEMTHRYVVFPVTGGFCAVAWSNFGITRLQLRSETAESTQRNLLRRLLRIEAGTPPAHVVAAIAAVQRYFEGEQVDFSGVGLDLDEQNEFFRKIYAATRHIGWGQTTTYGKLANEIGGGPETARDVGRAMAKNPVPLIIPCHRVLAAGGKLGGFSAPGGSDTKLRMLELEGVQVRMPHAQQTLSL